MCFGTVKFVLRVLDEDPNHHDKNDNVNEKDGKDGAQEGPKEHCTVKDKAAVERNENQGHSMIGNGNWTTICRGGKVQETSIQGIQKLDTEMKIRAIFLLDGWPQVIYIVIVRSTYKDSLQYALSQIQ